MNPLQLTEFMKRHKFDQRSLAELLGVTWQAVRHWECGTRAVPLPVSRTLKLFDKFPQLIKEFGK